MNLIFIEYNRDNFDDALKLEVHPEQKKFAPSVAESLAAAYVKPWDEALDPYLIYDNETLIGGFYISYTPKSKNNYWLGGFFIDKNFQNQGYGKVAFKLILEFIKEKHPACELISLTVEKENRVAQNLYKSFGFDDSAEENKYGEIIYRLPV